MLRNRIVLIAPRQGIVIHGGMDIYDNAGAKRAAAWIKIKEAEYGEVERILLAGGTVRIMDPDESIPVPLQPGKGLLIPAGGDQQ